MVEFFPIKRIIIGCRMPKTDKEFLYRFAERKGIEVCHMKMRDDEFLLDMCPVDVQSYFEHEAFMKELKSG